MAFLQFIDFGSGFIPGRPEGVPLGRPVSRSEHGACQPRKPRKPNEMRDPVESHCNVELGRRLRQTNGVSRPPGRLSVAAPRRGDPGAADSREPRHDPASGSPISNIPWNFRFLRTPIVGEIEMELLIRPVVEVALRQRLFSRGERVTEEEVDEDWRSIRVPGTRRAALAAVRSSSRGYEGYLARIRIPTLVLWGTDDRIL